MKLDFRNASPDMVISLFSKTSGITIVKDPALSQPITLTSAKAVPLDQAFEILNAALSLRNFEMSKEGSVLVIKAKRQANRGGGGTTIDPRMFQGMTGSTQTPTELKVYQLKFAAAATVARMINDVFLQQQQSNNPFSMFSPMMGGRGGRGGFNMSSMFGGGQQGATVRASSEDYSNSVIVNAPSKEHRQVKELIDQIDKQVDDPLKAKVYKMEFAAAADLQPVIQNLLTANAPRGRGAADPSQNQNRQFSFFPFGGGNRNQQQATVTTDARSNSLVVTTTEANQVLVGEIVKELDTKIEMQSTTFVFPLDNARADNVANLLRQAFGTRQGAGNNRTGGTTTGRTGTNTGRTNTGRTGTGGGTGGGLGIGGENQNDSELVFEVDENGELKTNVVAQGFGFFQQGGGQQNRQNTNAPQTGRDAQGRIVPVQDLTGQVTVIPDQNTNSLIVVTTPENAEMIKRILGQLDRIPEQVMIETMIVEATLDSSNKLGVEWALAQDKAFGNTGTTGNASTAFGIGSTAQGFKYTLAGGQLTALVNALQTDTKFQVLSTPKIFTSNNEQAEINISQRVPFVVSQRTDANGNITYNYDFEDVGIVLTVTPRITSNGYVTMDVSQTANDLQGFTSFNAPIVNQRQAETTVSVKDGETLILGGIIRSTVTATTNKVPLLGDIPLLGNLFKSTTKGNTKTELIVLLTPRVVRDPAEAERLRQEEEKRLSKQSQEELKKARGGGTEQTKVSAPPTKGGGR